MIPHRLTEWAATATPCDGVPRMGKLPNSKPQWNRVDVGYIVLRALNGALGLLGLKTERAGLASLYRLLGCVGAGFATRELRAEEGNPLIWREIAMGASERLGQSVQVPER